MNFSFGEGENVEIVEMEDDSLCRHDSREIFFLPLRKKKQKEVHKPHSFNSVLIEN